MHSKDADGMNSDTTSESYGRLVEGATVVITHRVREGKNADYESWLSEISPLCKASPGYLDWHIVRQYPA
jgi:hypothetical protein